MTDSNLFDAPNSAPPVEDQPPADGEFLSNLVGEGKKYSDPELLAKSAWHKEQHIKRIEAENARLAAEVAKRANSEDFMTKIMQRIEQKPPSNPDHQSGNEQQVKAPSEEDIAKLVRETYNQEETRRRQAQNVDYVRSELTKVWGNDYVSKLERLTQQLGETKESIADMAKNKPQLLLLAVKSAVATPTPDNSYAPPRSSGGATTGDHANTGEPRDWNYYEKIRKSDPKLYWNPETQKKLLADAYKLGDNFKKS